MIGTRSARQFGVRALITACTACAAAFAGNALAQDDEIDAAMLEEIVVTGLRMQLRRAAEQERAADTIKSVLTADDVGNFPDQTLAESLSRLAGVSVLDEEGEGRFITVRGLDPDFVQVTINNAQLGSSDAGGDRSVALDVVPGDLFQSVDVGKTLLPDTDHDSFGAKVDLRPLSAFSRDGDFSGRISLRSQYGELAEAWDPNIRADLTRKFDLAGDGRGGVAVALSYNDRTVHGDQLRSTSGGGINETQNFLGEPATPILAIQELDQRMERGDRERIGGTLVLDLEPTDNFRMQLSGIYGRLKDNDIRVQQEVELRDASDSETVLIERGHGIFTDVDLERQIFFIPSEEETYAVHLEADYSFGQGNNPWLLSVAFDDSRNNFSIDVDSNRGRWRERDAVVEAWWNGEDAWYEVLGRGDNDNPPLDLTFSPGPSDFEFAQIGVIEEDRFDDIQSFNIDLERAFSFGDRDVTFKAGFKVRERARGFVRGELFESFDPDEAEALGYPGSLESVPTFVPRTAFDINGGIPGGAIYPELGFARGMLAEFRRAFGVFPTEVRRDYTATEDTDAAYLMATFDLTDKWRVIAGVRWEATDYTANGLTETEIEIEDVDPNDPTQTITIPLLAAIDPISYKHDYDNLFPALHFRFDATDAVVMRFGYSRGQVRPGYGDANGLINNEYEFIAQTGDLDGTCAGYTDVTLVGNTYSVCTDDYNIQTDGGNPFLDPMIADQFDVNIGWYPNEDSHLTAAIYHKAIDDYIIGVGTSNPETIAALGGNSIDPLTGFATTDFDKAINVSEAELSGFELSGRHQMRYLPGFLSNIFIAANGAWLEGSTSAPIIQDGADVDLPGLADFVGNFAIAYEDDRFNFQISTRYRTGRLNSLDADNPEETVFDESDFRLGFSTYFDFNDTFRIFANGSNLTNEKGIRYFAGNEASGRLVNRRADFGRTYRIGFDTRF